MFADCVACSSSASSAGGGSTALAVIFAATSATDALERTLIATFASGAGCAGTAAGSAVDVCVTASEPSDAVVARGFLILILMLAPLELA